jgi:hypothetical protein
MNCSTSRLVAVRLVMWSVGCCDGESGHFVVGAYLSNSPKISVTSPTLTKRTLHHSRNLSRKKSERLDHIFEKKSKQQSYIQQRENQMNEFHVMSGWIQHVADADWLNDPSSRPPINAMIGN